MQEARRSRWQVRDIVALGLCVGTIALSLVLWLTPDGNVSFDRGGKVGFPGFCLFRAATHVNCPGCGLVRSFVAMGHLDLAMAWRLNRVGPLLFAFVLLQVPYRALRLAWRRFYERTEAQDARVTHAMLWGFVALLLVNWALTLTRLVP